MYQKLERPVVPFPWMDDALCRDTDDPDLWFRAAELTRYSERDTALAICAVCPAQEACLNYALTEDLMDGIYGGLTPEQRRNIKRRMQRN